MKYLIFKIAEKFAISLLMTLGLECLGAWLWNIREKRAYMILLLVNILTNPAAVMICWGFQLLFPDLPYMVYQLPLECIITYAEGYVYRSFNQTWKSSPETLEKYGEYARDLFRKPFWFSVFANALSYSTGCLVMFGKGGVL